MEKNFKDFMDLSKRQGKVMIVGNEGAGKTLLATYIGIQKMLRGQEDCWKSFDVVNEYNSLGYKFSTNYQHLVFSNYDINCSGTFIPSFKSNKLDPFRVGLSCDDYETYPYPPYSFMIITECQRVFNAYMWPYIRPEIRAFWETSRQGKVELIMDTNQPNLVYSGMRSLCNRVIYLYQNVEEIKKDNVVIGHRLFIKEFSSYKYFERYNENAKHELIKDEYELYIPMCIYNNFDSEQCRYLHLKGRQEQDYIIEHFSKPATIEEVEAFVNNFGLLAPDGYYVTKKVKKKDNAETTDFSKFADFNLDF